MENLGVFGILKKALTIPYQCPKFIFLTFLTTLPLFFFMLLHEIILRQTLIELRSFFTSSPATLFDFPYITLFWQQLDASIVWFQDIAPRFLQLGFLYLVPLHLLDLLNAIFTVDSASAIYAGEVEVSLKEILNRPVSKSRFKGPFITSLYVLSLNCLILFGLIWTVTISIVPSSAIFFLVLYGFFYGVGSIVLIVKWMEWSALWNMSIVYAILEEVCGLEALWSSVYFSRGNKNVGFYLMLIFSVWRFGFRLLCFYYAGKYDKWVGLVSSAVLSCVSNVMKWLVFTVYFCDCKEKKKSASVDCRVTLDVNV